MNATKNKSTPAGAVLFRWLKMVSVLVDVWGIKQEIQDLKAEGHRAKTDNLKMRLWRAERGT